MLDIEIPGNKDFYYMPGIGYGGAEAYNWDYDKIITEDFYPQTNFYFINTSKIDYLNNQHYLDMTYDLIKNVPDYNGKVWEYIPGWSCEDFLKQCVIRNNLSKFSLVQDDKFRILLNAIRHYNIHDSSHKNIMINGICHYHNINNEVIYIA